MKTIKLENSDQVAVVDDEDFDRLKDHRWLLSPKGYVIRYYGSTDNRHQVFLHNDVMGLPPDSGVDHRNNCKWDNQKENLRVVTQSVNCQNKQHSGRNTTGFKGVSFVSARGRYRAKLGYQGKLIDCGTFETPEDAARAYDQMALKYYGPDALTNQSMGRLG